MKRFYLLLLILSAVTAGYAQAPQRIPFQGLVRDNANIAVASGTPVKLRFTILDLTTTGSPVFFETDTATVNQFGLVTAQVGSLGNLAVVNWGSGAKYLKVEMDVNNTGTFGNYGVPQLISVPYALYAANSAQGPTGAAGPNGTNGLTGATGPNGLNGATGPAGSGATSAGPTGPKGPTGPAGGAGQNAANGTAGNNGANGLNGATGPAGPTGAQGGLGSGAGPQGPAGLTGPTGTPGGPGPQGPQGPTLNGATGSAGRTGGTGPAGGLGVAGPQGPQGPAGAAGNNGATGPTGNTGLSGTGGSAGVQGPRGGTGQQGATGVSGFYGIVYISPVDVINTAGSMSTWATIDASAYIPTTAKCVVLESEGNISQPDDDTGGLLDGYIWISQQGGVYPQYLLSRCRSAGGGDNFARATQGKFPCQNAHFDYFIPVPGWNNGVIVRVIGYIP